MFGALDAGQSMACLLQPSFWRVQTLQETARRPATRTGGATDTRGILEPLMIDPVQFQRAELESTLRQLKTFAQNGPPAAEQAGSSLLAFSHAATAFVEAFGRDPNTSPRELLLAAGQAHGQLEALHREFDCAMDQLERLPFKLDLDAAPSGERLPEDPRPEGNDET